MPAIALTMIRPVRVLILKGAGGKAFVAGTDIAQFTEFREPEDGIAYEQRIDQVLDRLERVTKATIAQIQGVAAGGGCAIALTCDLRVATPESSFGIPVARTLGNCLSGATYSRLVDLLGPGLVKDMLLTGRFIPGAEALALGMISRVEPAEEIDRLVREYAFGIAANAPLTVRATKEMIRRISAARRLPPVRIRHRDDVLHEPGLPRRDRGVSGEAPAEMDRHASRSRGSQVGSRSRSRVDSRSRQSRPSRHVTDLQRNSGQLAKAGPSGTSLFERQLGVHRGRQRRAGEEESHRADERQVPVAGGVDDESERERRQDGRERRAGIHESAGRARVSRRDVHRDRPHRPDDDLGEEERTRQADDDDRQIVGDEDRKHADERREKRPEHQLASAPSGHHPCAAGSRR